MKKRIRILILLFCFAGTALAEGRVEKNVVYGMYSGLALLMDIYQPDKPNGYGVVFIMGSGWHMPLSYGTGSLKDRAANDNFLKTLSAAGYTVFAINHRAAPRFRYPAAVEDAQRAVRFVRHRAKQYAINPDRIGGVGGSSGGHLVSMLGTMDGKGDPEDSDQINRESSRLQCVVARAAPADLAKIKTESGLMAVTSFVGVPSILERKIYRDTSPVTYVSADDAPFLLIHGDKDDTVPFEQSEIMEAALKKSGVEVKLIRVPGGGHGLEGATNPPDYLGETVRWLNRHLGVSR